MALISLQDISLSFGGPLIFDGLSVQLEPGERVALLGRNGAGKTTLMKVIVGEVDVDDGKIIRQKGLQAAYLPQEIPDSLTGTVFDVALAGLGPRATLLGEYHRVSRALRDEQPAEQSAELLRELDRLQAELDRTGGWAVSRQVESVISRMGLDAEADVDFTQLSGGQKRRALLAKALVCEPDILLLDEPTNHLDLDSITWLEEFLRGFAGTLLFVTHDRMFMSNVATRTMELDRGRMYSWACDYRTFLERKQMALTVEASQQAEFDRILAREEAWVRQGVKARRARNEGRVRALERLREEKRQQRREVGTARMKTQDVELSGRRVIKAVNLSHRYGERWLFRGFTTNIMRGDKIGVIGPNGCGKTTLLRALLGELAPEHGTVKLGANLQVAYYDQLREQLDGEKTVMQNVCGDGETVIINGKPRHGIGYLQDFLFSAERTRVRVSSLSGGERNRLCLARLFAKPSNLLVMDEPTNDLDIETLELLEALLVEYEGTLLLVSHDREFLNNVVTSTIVFEDDGTLGEYVGGYDDWLRAKEATEAERAVAVAKKPAKGAKAATKPAANPAAKSADARKSEEAKVPSAKPPSAKSRKLTYKESRELESLPGEIERLEAEQQALTALMASSEFYKRPTQEIVNTKARLETVQHTLRAAYQRWEDLEERNHA